jgi:methanogenic corrinoid protein MtbC1
LELDGNAIYELLAKAESDIGYTRSVEEVAFPELYQLGEAWHKGESTIAQEHVATLEVRSYLVHYKTRQALKRDASANAPRIVLACVPGELHDLPILHLANLLAHRGALQVTALAAGLPLEDILAVVARQSASVLLLSATMPVTSATVREWVNDIRESACEERCILAGGAFLNSRIFSETKVRAAAGNYTQAAELVLAMAQVPEGAKQKH